MAPYASQATLKLYQPYAAATPVQHNIDTPLRKAHFFAQLVHESGQFRYAEEIASGTAYEGRADLGNTQQQLAPCPLKDKSSRRMLSRSRGSKSASAE